MVILNALKWSFLSEITPKAIQPIVFILLARLLTPEDFGVMASALMVMSFSQILWEAGMSKALIQRESDIEETANVVFWINITLGIFIITLLYFSSDKIAHFFFQDDRVSNVLKVMMLQIFLGSIGAVHSALLQKNMAFKKLFWVRFTTVSLPNLASLPLAYYGFGYWALVIGSLIGQLIQVIMLWNISSWRPKAEFNQYLAKQISQFGSWVGASALLSWFYAWADSLIVGMFFGSHILGLFKTGSQFTGIIFGMLVGPILPVLYSHFVKINKESNRIRDNLEKAIKILTLIGTPLAFSILTASNEIEKIVFGQEWIGINHVISAMALTQGISLTSSANGEFYRAIGKPSYETIVNAIMLFIYLSAYIISSSYGFDYFLWTRFSLSIAALALHLYVVHKIVKLNLTPLINFILRILLPSILIAIAIASMKYTYDTQILLGLGISLLGTILIYASIYILERKYITNEIRQALAKK